MQAEVLRKQGFTDSMIELYRVCNEVRPANETVKTERPPVDYN